MNIAIDIRNIGRNRTGSEMVILELVKRVVAHDAINDYFLLTDTDDPIILAAIDDVLQIGSQKNVKVVTLWSPHRVYWLMVAVALFAKKASIDVFHTEYIVPFFIPQKTRVLTHIHDVSFAVPTVRSLINKKDLLFLDHLIPRSLRRADRVIAVSEFTRSEIVKYYKHRISGIDQKITVIANASTEEFALCENMQSTRQKYKLPEKYILSLGTMQPRKNIPFLIQAFAEIAQKLPDVDLVLSGKRGYQFDEIIDKILLKNQDLKERIHFTGFIDQSDLPCVYKGAKCLVSPSIYEGFGMPIVEAFRAEIPVIASDIPVYREVAQDAALFFDPHQIDQCTAALYTVCTDQGVVEALLVSAKNRTEYYNWNTSAQKFQIELEG